MEPRLKIVLAPIAIWEPIPSNAMQQLGKTFTLYDFGLFFQVCCTVFWRRAHRDIGWPHQVGLRASLWGRPSPRQVAIHRHAKGSHGVELGLQALQVEGKYEVVKVRQPTVRRRCFCSGRWRFLHAAYKGHQAVENRPVCTLWSRKWTNTGSTIIQVTIQACLSQDCRIKEDSMWLQWAQAKIAARLSNNLP